MKIKVKIEDKYYMADTSALTALRFRSNFNKSVITNELTPDDALNLLYVAVGSEKLLYEKFCALKLKKANAADMFISAHAVLREMMKDSGIQREVIKKADEKIQEDGNTIYDEFCIIAVMTNIGLSLDLLKEVSIIQLMYIIAQTYEMKYGKKESVEIMTDDELIDALNITDERLNQIEEYYRLHPEEMPEEE